MTAKIAIIPQPAEIVMLKGVFRFGAPLQFECDSRFAAIIGPLRQFVMSIHPGDSCGTKRHAMGNGSIELQLAPRRKNGGKESYEIEISPSRVLITAPSPAGLFYGVQSLKQIIQGAVRRKGRWPTLPCLRVKDSPRFEWRGFMIDSSRHFQDVPTLKKLIDLLAYYKINRLHWHFVDSQSWRFKSGRYPGMAKFIRGISTDPGDYTAEQMREVVRYAAERFITVYPELEMPGHSQAALSVRPQLKCQGIPGNIVVNEYCLGKPQTQGFLQDLILELETIFPSPFVHIGGDEASDANWKFCKHCKTAMRKRRLKTTALLQKDFMKRMSAFVHSRHKISIAWADKLALGIPKGQIVQGWFDDKQSFEAAQRGFKTINSFHRSVYFDYPQKAGEARYHWMFDLPLKKVYEFDPVPRGLSRMQEKQVIGSEACLWTELVPQEKLFAKIFPRLLAFAEVVWSPRGKRDYPSFLRRSASHGAIL